MYQSVPVEEKEGTRVGILLLIAIGALVFLALVVTVSLFEPEWVNFMWLSVATVSMAALAGWVIGYFLDALLEEVA